MTISSIDNRVINQFVKFKIRQVQLSTNLSNLKSVNNTHHTVTYSIFHLLCVVMGYQCSIDLSV